MPRITNLIGFHIAVVEGKEEIVAEGNGEPQFVDVWEPQFVDVWMLVFTDRQTQDQIRISFREESRNSLVRQLTGGVVLAGGDFPKV